MDKTLTKIVITLLDGSTVTAQDTVEKSPASNALAQFKDYKTMVIPEEGKTTYIPFHAVLKIEVTTSKESVEPVEDEACKPVECCPTDEGEEGGEGNNG